MLRIRQVTIQRLEILLIVCALVLLVAAGGQALAQIQRAEQSDHEERRIERRIERRMDAAQKAHDDLRLEIERRLIKIETYVYAGIWLIGGIYLAVIGQLVKLGRDVVLRLRAANGKGGEAPPA